VIRKIYLKIYFSICRKI